MDLDRGDLHRLESIEKRDGRVGVSARIYYDAVGLVEICLLDVVDQVAFVIALETCEFYAFVLAVLLDHGDEIFVCLGAVDVGLPDAEHVKVRSVKY